MRITTEPDGGPSAAFAVPEADLPRTADLRVKTQSRPAGSTSIHRLNSALTVLVVALLLLSPIPLGSNRPPLWMLWASYVGIVASAYGAALLVLRASPRILIGAIRVEMTLWLALILFICLQLLPLGRFLPLGEVALPGATLGLDRLTLDPGASRLALLQFATYGILYYLALQIAANRRRARRLLYVLLGIITGFAILGLSSLTMFGDTLLGFEKSAYLGYATGTFINRNSFATYLATGLVLGTALLLQVLSERENRTIAAFSGLLGVIVLALALIGAALLATGSRMGGLSALVGVLAVAALALFAYRGSVRIGALAIFGLVVLAVPIAAVFGENLVERLVFTPWQDQTRLNGYAVIWSAIFERPLLGYGVGSFPAVFQALQAPPMAVDSYWLHSHSTYLALWFELGLVVGSVPLAIVAVAMWRTLMSLTDSSSTVASLAAIGCVVVFAVHSILDFSAEIQANSFLLISLVALGAAGWRPRRAPADQPVNVA